MDTPVAMIQGDRHSRTIALLKVLFPLAALALLSTLFLLSRAMEPETVIPFAEKEVQERLRDQQVTGPFFSSTTADGDQISFSAEKLIRLDEMIGTNRAVDAFASSQSTDGARFQVEADLVELDIAADRAHLSGDVILKTSTGYTLLTTQIDSLMSRLDLQAPMKVTAQGPLGDLVAGNMRIFTPKNTESTQMVFSNGVKLVYTPN